MWRILNENVRRRKRAAVACGIGSISISERRSVQVLLEVARSGRVPELLIELGCAARGERHGAATVAGSPRLERRHQVPANTFAATARQNQDLINPRRHTADVEGSAGGPGDVTN